MAQNSSIEWTGATWNPVTGCSYISDGCRNCYARRMAMRLHAMGNRRYVNGFNVTLHPDLLDTPLRWRTSKLIFVNSMSDLFHEDIPIEFILQVFTTIRQAKQHTFQVLTKRAERLHDLSDELDWPDNLWMGVTVESGKYTNRIDLLRKVPAAVKFLSIEPMVGPVGKLDLTSIDWVIVGGESGPGARPIEKIWVNNIKDQCIVGGVPFFFKQWGGVNKKKTGRLLDGKTWSQYPLSVNI
ncbi:MAG: phage Gp37/Gp68 family protein [Deltaproteobacteria bacterium]|jgi:protein gp37|nr:phage Gp37/Gp68 family protein [Deltaproteobacteria bacterium]